MAVYTEVSDDELARFIASYQVGALLPFKGIAEGVENTNYLIHTESGPYFLTLYQKRVAPQDLPFFLGLMEHLANAGIRCPTPVRDADGQSLRQLAGRPAALVTFLEGVWIRRPQVLHCAAVGQDLALRRANALGLSGWHPLYARFKDHADQIAAGLGDIIEQELDHLARHWPRDLAQGVIHADLFPDNVFFLGDQLSGLIDFYFACNDTLAYDVAICLNAWCFEPDHSYNVTKGRALLQGYVSERALSREERACLPLLARGSALRFLLTRLVDWLNVPPGALVRPKDPLEYFRKLRFHQAARSVRDYGIAE